MDLSKNNVPAGIACFPALLPSDVGKDFHPVSEHAWLIVYVPMDEEHGTGLQLVGGRKDLKLDGHFEPIYFGIDAAKKPRPNETVPLRKDADPDDD